MSAVLAWTRTPQVANRREIAIDDKTIRNARSARSVAPHLVAAPDHATGAVLGQHTVDTESNEIPAVRDPLARFDPADSHGCVITTDATHTHDDTVAAILDAGADYVLTIKANRPALLKALKTLPCRQTPTGSTTTQTGHGRQAKCTINTISPLFVEGSVMWRGCGCRGWRGGGAVPPGVWRHQL